MTGNRDYLDAYGDDCDVRCDVVAVLPRLAQVGKSEVTKETGRRGDSEKEAEAERELTSRLSIERRALADKLRLGSEQVALADIVHDAQASQNANDEPEGHAESEGETVERPAFAPFVQQNVIANEQELPRPCHEDFLKNGLKRKANS